MKYILTDDEYDRLVNKEHEFSHKCKCVHRVLIPYNKTKMLCRYCGRYVFKSKKDEFIYRVLENENKNKTN